MDYSNQDTNPTDAKRREVLGKAVLLAPVVISISAHSAVAATGTEAEPYDAVYQS